jgi:hypothetical protein
MIRRTSALALVLAASFALTGCFGTSPGGSGDGGSAGGGTGSQSTADACTVVSDSVDQAISGFQNLDTTDDPSTLADAMTAAADAIGDAAGQIDNSEVKEAAEGVQAAYAQIAELTAAMANGEESSPEDSTAFATEYQEALTTFAELCGPQG